jgi:hypothetical protein
MDFTDREVVMKAVKNNGHSLKYAPLFENDREIVMEAVKSNGFTVCYYTPFKTEYIFYGRILDFKELKKEMWKENGIAEGLMMHFGHPNKVF